MELTKNHRQALLEELSKAIQDLELKKTCLMKHSNDDIAPFFGVGDFLAQQRIDVIKKALIDNEIDY